MVKSLILLVLLLNSESNVNLDKTTLKHNQVLFLQINLYITQLFDKIPAAKGQFKLQIAELIYEVIVSPKIPTKNYRDFCRTF